MLKINEKSKENIETIVGLPISSISKMIFSEIDKSIETKIGKNLRVVSLTDPMLVGRGSVLITGNRLSTSDQIEERLSKI